MSAGTVGAWDGLTPPYATIAADPPWPYDEYAYGRPDRPFLPYSMMALDEIRALPVADLAAPGAHLYLWTTNRFLEDAYRIVRAWRFIPSHTLVWCKPPHGLGGGGPFTITTEFVVRATSQVKPYVARAGALIRQARLAAGLSTDELAAVVRGKVTGIARLWESDDCLPNEQDWIRLQAVLPTLRETSRPRIPKPEFKDRGTTTWFQWPRGAHSEKPPAFLDLVEQVSPGPYVELFARQPRLGWDSWGFGYEQGGAA